MGARSEKNFSMFKQALMLANASSRLEDLGPFQHLT